MKKKKIYIVTGSKRTGKTTRLMNWVLSQKDINGILQPVVNGKRCLYHISSKTFQLLESDSNIDTINVGKFKFKKDVIDWANKKLIESVEGNYKWIVVDEIGLLELNGAGFDKSIKILLSRARANLIFVIRDQLLTKALEHYKITDYNILEL
ncbi:MAG: hypothetical protein N2249_07360 [Melioribacter sp.]|nr:hypothetical protein [Melioribacter sp.]